MADADKADNAERAALPLLYFSAAEKHKMKRVLGAVKL